MTDLDSLIRWRIYQHFIETGAPPTVPDLARGAGSTALEIERSLDRLAEAHSIVLAPGSHHLWMAHPFSAVPTSYPVVTDEKRYWANCAWDALGIPAMLGSDSTTETACPDCDEPLTLRVAGGRVSPEDAVVHFLVPAREFWKDIGFT